MVYHEKPAQMYRFGLKVNHDHSRQPVSELRLFFSFPANTDGTITLKQNKDTSTHFPFPPKCMYCHQVLQKHKMMSWIWSLKKEIASNFSRLSVAIWLPTLEFILTTVLKNFLSTAFLCSLLTSLFCRRNITSTCLGFKYVRNLGFEGDQSMYRRNWLLDRLVSVSVCCSSTGSLLLSAIITSQD